MAKKEYFTCPRRIEDGMADENSPFTYSGSNLDTWRKDNTCSYCGSLDPETFLEAVELGNPVGATDKNYKMYIDLPGSGKKVKTISQNFKPQKGEGFKKVPFKNEWYKTEPEVTRHAKFYFQHLDTDQKKKFVDLVNQKKLNYQGGIGLYVLPYFMRPSNEGE